jgi:hypothetical protein
MSERNQLMNLKINNDNNTLFTYMILSNCVTSLFAVETTRKRVSSAYFKIFFLFRI